MVCSRMRKKGSTETLSFLIGILIFILIVVPIGIAVYHYMQSQTGMQRTLDLLVERTSELEDGQSGNIVGYIDKGYVLISFEKDRGTFGGTGIRWTCEGVGGETFAQLWRINKPSQCRGRACLCACGESAKDVPLVGDWLNIIGPDFCSGAKCVVYDEDKSPRFYGGASCEYGAFIVPENPTLEINFERQGQTIGICEEPPCISKEVQKAREIFTSTYDAYMECKNNNLNDCICGTVDLAKLPSDNNIEFSSDGSKTTMRLTDDDGPLRGIMYISPDLMGVYYPSTDTEKLVASFKTDKQPAPDEGYEDDVYITFGDNGRYGTNGEIMLYKSKAGNVNFVVEDRPIPREKNYCRVLELIAQEEANPAPEGSISIYYDEGNACSFRETTGGITAAGICRRECSTGEYEIGRRGENCEALKCCGLALDKGCAEKGGACTKGSCEPSSQTEITGEDLCPAERPACCKSGSLCENLAGGKCKGACDGRLNEEEASGSLFTSPACGGGYKCCVQIPVPLGTG
ncbi:MAG: hypothetical protein QME12_03260 [Nanoarchaeota archaeon]|nr:hypothetical protein [Nanoarchaeota archaeon]